MEPKPMCDETWIEIDGVIERAARRTRLYRVDDRVDFSNEVAGRARLKALLTLPKVESLDCPSGYARSIVQSVGVDLLRAHNRDRKRFVSLDTPDVVEFAEPSACDTPEALLLKGEQAASVRQAFRRLMFENPRRARVLWMREVEGLGTAEIAEAERTTATNIQQILHRGREHLRRCFLALGAISVPAVQQCQSRNARNYGFGCQQIAFRFVLSS